MPENETQKNVYALLVGINEYPIPSHRLAGCVNDVMAVKEYLEQRTNSDQANLDLVMLLDDKATRFNIVEQFETHLRKAKEGDIAFFYYSGHGSQEPAHEAFWHLEPDHMNETIVCWDSRIQDGMDLADKEMATLIDMVAENNPHVVVVLDCCHSGSGTRNTDDTVERQASVYENSRPLESYILPRNMNTERAALSTDATEELIIPEGRHVNLSGAHSSQTAKETTLNGARRGVFTFSLLKVLQNATGQLSYADLVRRVRTMISNKVNDQNPQIFATNIDDADMVFLDGSMRVKPNYYTLSFDRDHGWTIDAGAVHGIIAGADRNNTTILTLFKGDASEDELRDLSNSLGQAFVTNVKSNISVIDTDESLDSQTGYKAVLTTLPLEKLRIAIEGDSAGAATARDALNFRPDTNGPSLFLEEVNGFDADYVLKAQDNQYVIVRHADDQDRPLVEQIDEFSMESAIKAIDNLEHIARWEQTMELANPGSTLASESVAVEVYSNIPGVGDTKIGVAGEEILLEYHIDDLPENRPKFKVKLVNNSPHRLYCSLLYMSSQYEVNPGLIPQAGEWLDPGEEMWAISGRAFTASVDDAWVPIRGKVNAQSGELETELRESFKLVCGTNPFDGNLFKQPKLGLPRASHRGAGGMSALENMFGKVQTRDLLFSAPPAGPLDDWNTSEISVRIKRSEGVPIA